MFRYIACTYTTSVIILLTSFSSVALSLFVHQYPNDVYASITISCNQITDLMTCENQQNLQTSSDDNGPIIDSDNDSSAPNSEKDEIPLLIPDIAPTIDNNRGDDSDDESSGQDNSEDGNDDDNDRANGGEKSDGDSNDGSDSSDDGNNLEIAVPSLLPFP